MKKRALFLFLLSSLMTLAADDRSDGLRLLVPEDQAIVYMPHPHFRWQKGADARIEDRYQIQVSRDNAFRNLVVDDSLDVVSRFVCPKPLPPGTYFWRLRPADAKAWSKTFRFKRDDSREFRIEVGVRQADIAATIAEAAANTPAKVIFEKGSYRITESISLRGVK
ncbi:MAG: hypothetical protein QF886_01685, partial [Planctomycetota bacterium]|nr:hypothetical protein [Planctomycetota bacterium]